MKYTCLNYENCDYYEYLKDEDLNPSPQPVIKCPECNSLAVLVSNTFNIKDELEALPLFVFEEEQ